MIVYDLQCSSGHGFEGWFEDHRAYEQQKKKGLINCPVCNSDQVSKIPSTFAIKGNAASQTLSVPESEVPSAELAQKVQEFVEKNFDDVGCDFAKEALKIHYGASEPRNIRGVSTKSEEKTLREEGVPFFKVPLPRSSENES